VLAGLEVFKTLNDAGVTTAAPLEVVVWTNEEGSRFVPVMMGSGAFIGEFKTDFILAQKDRDGITVGQALHSIGYAGKDQVSPSGIGAYFEAHIEQGPVLEAHDITIGVVTGALGQRWFDVVITGSEASECEAACLEAGANLFLEKASPPNTIIEGLRTFLPSPKEEGVATGAVPAPTKLSKRQKQLILMLDQGLSNKDIADKLTISEHTVKVHFWRLFRRLGVNSRTQALHFARTNGWLGI
jgi:DNA-binding CsgD family transcriptional regulator